MKKNHNSIFSKKQNETVPLTIIGRAYFAFEKPSVYRYFQSLHIWAILIVFQMPEMATIFFRSFRNRIKFLTLRTAVSIDVFVHKL